jgi:hypothetical protein
MAAAVESEVPSIIYFLLTLVCRRWDIRHKLKRDEVFINPKEK